MGCALLDCLGTSISIGFVAQGSPIYTCLKSGSKIGTMEIKNQKDPDACIQLKYLKMTIDKEELTAFT